jgi:hypothetical protein
MRPHQHFEPTFDRTLRVWRIQSFVEIRTITGTIGLTINFRWMSTNPLPVAFLAIHFVQPQASASTTLPMEL